MPSIKRPTIAPRSLLLAGLLLYVVLVQTPLDFALPVRGIDPAWMQVLTHAAAHGWQWGRDIVFTFGPFGYLYTHLFHEALAPGLILLHTALALALGLGIVNLAGRRHPLTLLASAGVILLAVSLYEDTLYFLLPLLLAAGQFRTPQPVPAARLVPLAAAMALAGLVKLSFAMLALFVLPLIDLHRLLHRRAPLFTPVFLAAFLGFHFVAGQDPAHLGAFLRLSVAVAAGYSEAMAQAGRPEELLAFLGVSAAAGALVLWSERRSERLRTRPVDALFILLCLGGFWFMTFKAGFVRHDLHSVVSWACLGAGAAAYAASVWEAPAWPAAVVPPPLLLLVLATGSALTGAAILAASQDRPTRQLVAETFVDQPLGTVRNLVALASDPAGWFATAAAQRDAALALIRAAEPMPAVDGPVDLLTWSQGALLASGADYRPRPIFHEYSTYTPALVEANRAFLHGPRAPAYLMVRPVGVDRRYPSLAEGPLWPDILRLYRPVRLEETLLVLQRRAAAAPPVLDPETGAVARFGETVPVPNGPAFVRLEIDTSPLGTLATLLFRTPYVILTATLADGTETPYRLIPTMAREGFVLSPLIDDAGGFAALAAGRIGLVRHRAVTALRIDVSDWAKPLFKPGVRLRFQPIHPPDDDDSLPEAVWSGLRSDAVRRRMAASSPLRAPAVMLEPGRLLAHAPVTIPLDVPPTRRVTVGFGIRDGAWSNGGDTNGVCFRLSATAAGTAARMVWERCLRPVSEPPDRGPQSAEVLVDLPEGGRLDFATDCDGDCRWDWSYWAGVDFDGAAP